MPACFWAATSTLHLKPSLWLPSLSTPNRCILYTNRPEGRLFHAIRYGHSPAWSGRYTNGRHYWEPTLTTNSSSRHRYTFPLCAATTHALSHVKNRCLSKLRRWNRPPWTWKMSWAGAGGCGPCHADEAFRRRLVWEAGDELCHRLGGHAHDIWIFFIFYLEKRRKNQRGLCRLKSY